MASQRHRDKRNAWMGHRQRRQHIAPILIPSFICLDCLLLSMAKLEQDVRENRRRWAVKGEERLSCIYLYNI